MPIYICNYNSVLLTGHLHRCSITTDVTSYMRHMTRIVASVAVRGGDDTVASGGRRQRFESVLELALKSPLVASDVSWVSATCLTG